MYNKNDMKNMCKQMNIGKGNPNGNRNFGVLPVAYITFTSELNSEDLRSVLSI